MTDYTPPLYDHALDEDELRRSLLWKQQRNQRAAYRMRVQASLHGLIPVARTMLNDRWQPWVDHAFDMEMSPQPEDPDTVPVTNQNLNS